MISTFKQVKNAGSLKATSKTPTYGGYQTAEQVRDVNAVTPLCLRTLYGTVDYTP